MKHIFSVDVEGWTDRIAYSEYSDVQEDTSTREGTELLIKELSKHGHKATFFFLGTVVEQDPELVRLVDKHGHEVASHGYSHTPLNELNPESFDKELERTEQAIYKAIKKKPQGFRAPKFSLNNKTMWALDVLIKRGYIYDSSLYPAHIPIIGYGSKDYPSTEHTITRKKGTIKEYPVLVYDGVVRAPLKLRHTGVWTLEQGLRKITAKGKVGVVCVHPWEFVAKPDALKSVKTNKAKDSLRNFRIPASSALQSLLKKKTLRFTSIQAHIGDSNS